MFIPNYELRYSVIDRRAATAEQLWYSDVPRPFLPVRWVWERDYTSV